jgi:flagellin
MASFSVVSNIASSNAQANLQATSIGLQRALTRLSSGFRINQSGDDAAGLTVANGYRQDVAVLNQGIRNANDGLSDLQIKDGALNNISTLLDRMATLAAQSANGKTTAEARSAMSSEYDDLVAEIDRESTVAGLDQSAGFSVFVSNNNTSGNTNGQVKGTIAAVKTGTGTGTLGIKAGDISSQSKALTAVNSSRLALNSLGVAQGKIGTLQNRVQFAVSLAQSQMVNTKAAESRVRDANVAEESANMTRYNILTQSGIAALSQANQASSAVLALLR